MALNPIRLYILPGFPSLTNSHGFWAVPPLPAVADEEDDEAGVLLAGPFAPMLQRLQRAMLKMLCCWIWIREDERKGAGEEAYIHVPIGN